MSCQIGFGSEIVSGTGNGDGKRGREPGRKMAKPKI